MSELYKPGQYPLLRGAGQTGMTGPEIETILDDHIILYQDDLGNSRFVYYLNGDPISVLHLIGFETSKSSYMISNVYTEKNYRRKGYAAILIKKAREVLGEVVHSPEENQSVMGKAWAKSVKEPIMSDIIVNSIEFASGQEPEYSDTFATLVRANYTIRGKKLAQILGKQIRVLEKYLHELSKYDYGKKIIVSRVTEDDDVLVELSKSISNFIVRYLIDELQIESEPELQIENANEGDYTYSVKIDPNNMQVTVETEFDVLDE